MVGDLNGANGKRASLAQPDRSGEAPRANERAVLAANVLEGRVFVGNDDSRVVAGNGAIVNASAGIRPTADHATAFEQ